MAERRLGTLRHIVFILKTCMLNVANWFVSCSGIFAARTPARRALRLRECYGLPTVNRYHGTLTPPRNAPSRPFKEKTEVSLYPASASSQAAAPRGCYSSPEVAHSLAGGPGVGSCVASQKRKDPQHWIFCFQGTVKPVLIDPFTLQRTFFERISGSLKKFF